MIGNDELKHVGVLGMRWGHRTRVSSGEGVGISTRGRSGIAIGGDGRKHDKIFGKRNMTKVKDYLTGMTNARSFCKESWLLKKKYNSLDKTGKEKMEKKVRTALLVVSGIAVADLVIQMASQR